MHSFAEIQKMSDEEVARLNKELARKLALKVALTIAIPVAVHFAVKAICKKLEID